MTTAQAQEVFRIRPGVARVERPQGVLLVAPESGRAVRISGIAEELMPLLAGGACFDDLAQRLHCSHPQARDVVPKLRGFLDSMARSGILAAQAEVPRPGPRRYWTVDADPLARRLAAGLAWMPALLARGVLVLTLAAAVAGIWMLSRSGGLPSLRTLFAGFAPAGLLLWVLLVLPVHELAHAVACRLAGVPVGRAGLFLHGGVVPGPFVDTSHSYRVAARWPRFCIPAAGPWIDLLATGASAACLLALPADAPAHGVLAWLFVACGVLLLLDLNPLGPSDGSRMLEALFDDELARRSALSRQRSRLSPRRTVLLYRLACVTFVVAAVGLLVAWWG